MSFYTDRHTSTHIQIHTDTHTPRAGEMFQSLRAHTAFVELPAPTQYGLQLLITLAP